MLELDSDRLRLIALDPPQLIALLAGGAESQAALGMRVQASVLTPVVERAIRMKLAKMVNVEPAAYPWYTYWLAVVPTDAEPVGVGLIGFKGAPEVEGTYDGVGEVEIGYGIAPEFGSQGYTTEAARLLIAWAFTHAGCQAVIAPNVLKTNIASQRVLEKVGMTVYGETADALHYRLARAET